MHVLSDKLRDRSIFVGWGTGVGGIVGFNIGKEGGGAVQNKSKKIWSSEILRSTTKGKR